MKKSLLGLMFASLAMTSYAQDEVTYNFFDPEDCDAQGVLWLDSQEKIDKYVGEGKKIVLIDAQYEVKDEFNDYYYPESYADATLKGINNEGVEGGEGSVTGGIVLPAAEATNIFSSEGGGVLVAMPDCAVFELYLSSVDPDLFISLYAARMETSDFYACTFLWHNLPSWDSDGEPLATDYATWFKYESYMNLDLNYGDGTPDILSILSPKGNPVTGVLCNYNAGDMFVQGFRIRTYTSVSSDNGENGEDNAVDSIFTDNGRIKVYNLQGVPVLNSFDKSDLNSLANGIYVVNGKKMVIRK